MLLNQRRLFDATELSYGRSRHKSPETLDYSELTRLLTKNSTSLRSSSFDAGAALATVR